MTSTEAPAPPPTAQHDESFASKMHTSMTNLKLENPFRGIVRQISEANVQKKLDEADRLYKLGTLEAERGRHRHALKHLNECMVLQRENLGDDDTPEAARTLNAIGVVLSEIGEDFAALTALEEALYIRQTVQGPGHEDGAETLSNLTHLLRKVKEKEEAAEAARSGLEGIEEGDGEDGGRSSGDDDHDEDDDVQDLPFPRRRQLRREKSKSWCGTGSKPRRSTKGSSGSCRLSTKIESALNEGRRRSTMLLSGMKKEQLEALQRIDQEMDDLEEEEGKDMKAQLPTHKRASM